MAGRRKRKLSDTGLTQDIIEEIRRLLGCFLHIEEAFVFGSRAKGTFYTGSDIDIAVRGKEVNDNDVAALWAVFDGSLIPYFVDIVDYEHILDCSLKQHIDRVAIPIYKKEKAKAGKRMCRNEDF